MLNYPLCVPFLLYSAIGGGILAVAFIVFRGKRACFARARRVDNDGGSAGRRVA